MARRNEHPHRQQSRRGTGRVPARQAAVGHSTSTTPRSWRRRKPSLMRPPRQHGCGGEPGRRALRHRGHASGGAARPGQAARADPCRGPDGGTFQRQSPSSSKTKRPEGYAMYRYDEFDAFVRERVEQFRGQVARRLAGELDEDEFKPLRLMNGLYLQLHSYMLRIAIPYGTLSPTSCASSRTSRANTTGATATSRRARTCSPLVQLPTCPTSAELAEVEMHAMQTSGNCVRNITADQFAGGARRRDRRPAALCRNPPPVVDAPPGILVPAAEIQDRGNRRASRSRGDPVPRHRHPDRPERRRASSASRSMSAAGWAARR